MPLYLNDEQTMLRDTAKDFVAEHAPVSHMRALRDGKDAAGFSRDLWKQFAEMGFTGILIGEEQGGLGGGGGISNTSGALSVLSSTISGNSSGENGAGIFSNQRGQRVLKRFNVRPPVQLN